MKELQKWTECCAVDVFSSFLLPLCCPYLHCEALSLYLSCALSFCLVRTCSLYFPCWKTGVGDSSLCPVKSLFHNMMRTMCLWLGLRGTDWEIEAGLCSSPLASLKIGLHPWDRFKEFCTLTKSSCKLWITQVTVPCCAWTCSTETIALTIRLAFPMPTSSNRFVHITLFSLLLLVPLRHPLLVLLFLLFFLCLSLISFFPFRLTLPRYYLLSTRAEQISSQILFNSWSQAAIMLSSIALSQPITMPDELVSQSLSSFCPPTPIRS